LTIVLGMVEWWTDLLAARVEVDRMLAEEVNGNEGYNKELDELHALGAIQSHEQFLKRLRSRRAKVENELNNLRSR